LNQFYSGQLKSMPARLVSDDGRNTVIRPLIYCAEADLERFAGARAFPIIPCNLCGSQENLKRREMKELLRHLEQSNPKLRGNLLAALKNVRPSHLLDARLTSEDGKAEPEPAGEAFQADAAASSWVPASALHRPKAP
jgi:tRNA 2-thiocytidine biosynthesis protein TtcA